MQGVLPFQQMNYGPTCSNSLLYVASVTFPNIENKPMTRPCRKCPTNTERPPRRFRGPGARCTSLGKDHEVTIR